MSKGGLTMKEILESVRVRCAQYEAGIDPSHIVSTLHAVHAGFTKLCSHNPLWVETIDAEAFNHMNPVDVFLGPGKYNHLKSTVQEEQRIQLGYVPIRYTEPYKTYLKEVWKCLFLLRKKLHTRTAIVA